MLKMVRKNTIFKEHKNIQGYIPVASSKPEGGWEHFWTVT